MTQNNAQYDQITQHIEKIEYVKTNSEVKEGLRYDMNTWQMIKELTERKEPFGILFFKTTEDDDQPIICFQRPEAGSIEFRLFQRWDGNYISDSVILYPTDKWVEITKVEADFYLKGRYDLL